MMLNQTQCAFHATYLTPIFTHSKFLTHAFPAIELDLKRDYLQAKQWSRAYKIVCCPCPLLHPTYDAIWLALHMAWIIPSKAAQAATSKFSQNKSFSYPFDCCLVADGVAYKKYSCN